jgi:hypothetical protein
VSGTVYTIVSVGNTNFVAIGASANTVGVIFTATGVGSGTGTASDATLLEDTGFTISATADADAGEIDFVVIGTVKMPIMAEIRNIPTNEQVYADVIQKSDLLTDLMKDLDDAKRRNPLLLRKLRTRMELFNALKDELIAYDINGMPVGSKPTSISTLIQMFQLSDVPLGRPVLDVMHHLHVLNAPPDSDNDVEFDTAVFDGSIRFRNMLDYFRGPQKALRDELAAAKSFKGLDEKFVAALKTFKQSWKN